MNCFCFSAPAEVLAEHKHWNVLFYRLSERVLSEQHVLTEAHLLLHLPASPTPADTHARVRLYYVGIDKKTGKPTQFKVCQLLLVCFQYLLTLQKSGIRTLDDASLLDGLTIKLNLFKNIFKIIIYC